MLTLTLIIVFTMAGLLIFEQERQRKAKHRAATATLLNRIREIDVVRSFRLEANAAAPGWEG